MKRSSLIWIAAAVTGLLTSAMGFSAPGDMPIFNLPAKYVAVFKNGYAFVVREGQIKTRDGWAVTEQVPEASFGAYWIGAQDDAYLEQAIGSRELVETPVVAQTIEDLIELNPGKQAVFTVNDKPIQGKIVSTMLGSQVGSNPNYYLIETQEGTLAILKTWISRVMFTGAFSNQTVIKTYVNRIKVKLSEKKKPVKLNISYLQKGIGWTPSYLIHILDDKQARITMNATLINDAEDLENVDLSFTVGYPNFMYAGVVSPMAMQGTLYSFLSSLNGGSYRNTTGAMMNMQAQTTVNAYRGYADVSEDYYESVPDTMGQSVGELFFYQLSNVTVKKGERAYYNLFSKEVKYKNIYMWNVPNTAGVNINGYQTTPSASDADLQVWHTIELDNSTAYPWTTAPAFVVKENQPMAQDMINYTPKGAKINLKITVAPDIRTDKKEVETERKRAIRINSYYFDQVTVSGELYVKNYKNEEIDMEITKLLTGEVSSSTQNGKVSKMVENLKDVNFNSMIEWKLNLKPGKDATLKYVYTVYIRN